MSPEAPEAPAGDAVPMASPSAATAAIPRPASRRAESRRTCLIAEFPLRAGIRPARQTAESEYRRRRSRESEPDGRSAGHRTLSPPSQATCDLRDRDVEAAAFDSSGGVGGGFN